MFSFIAAVAALSVQSSKPLTEQIVLASMFKNGFAMILREMKVAGPGEYTLDRIPRASLGTLWFTTSDGLKLKSVKNVEVQDNVTVEAASFEELLRLNKGRQVSLVTVNLGTITGKLLSVAGDVVSLDSEGSIVMINRSEIRKIMLPSDSTTSSTVKTKHRVLQFDTEGTGSIFMLSLEQGMTWAPGYAVTLKDKKTLEIVGKATAVNDLEDLNDIEVRFITGWPNVPYAGIPDPLVDTAFLQAGVGGPGGFGGGQMATADGMFRNQAPAAKSFGEAMPVSDLGGIQAEDLFFYRQPNVKLKRGERGYFVVFITQAPYDELYTWDIDDFVQDSTYRPQPPNPQPEDIWHTIRFTNSSKMPFSTGSATIFKDGQIIGQDMMRYASVGGKTELKITKAMDVGADQLEEEVTRERGVLKNTYNQVTHDLVTLKGTLTVINHKTDAVTLRVRKQLTGEVVSTSPEAKIVKIARGLRDVNSRAMVEWTQTLQPGKSLTLTYTYKVYIRF